MDPEEYHFTFRASVLLVTPSWPGMPAIWYGCVTCVSGGPSGPTMQAEATDETAAGALCAALHAVAEVLLRPSLRSDRG